MPEPAVTTIIRRDYLTLAALLATIMTWLSCLVAFVFAWTIDFHPEVGFVFLVLSLIVSGFGLPFMAKRIKRISQLFQYGIPGDAVFDDFWQYRDHVRVRYHYDYQGTTFPGSAHISSLTYGQHFESGDTLPVLIDPRTPARSILPDVFS